MWVLVLLVSRHVSFASDEMTVSKRLAFVDSPELIKSDSDLPSGSHLKVAIVFHRDAARTPLTERYLDKGVNWTACGSGLQDDFPIRIMSTGTLPPKVQQDLGHRPLPGGCRMGIITDLGQQQV